MSLSREIPKGERVPRRRDPVTGMRLGKRNPRNGKMPTWVEPFGDARSRINLQRELDRLTMRVAQEAAETPRRGFLSRLANTNRQEGAE